MEQREHQEMVTKGAEGTTGHWGQEPTVPIPRRGFQIQMLLVMVSGHLLDQLTPMVIAWDFTVARFQKPFAAADPKSAHQFPARAARHTQQQAEPSWASCMARPGQAPKPPPAAP